MQGQGSTGFLAGHPEAECFESRFGSPRAARAALSELPLSASLGDTARYVLAELANNAVIHAGPEFVARIWYDASWARIEVEDSSPLMPVRREVSSSVSGRGLLIVSGLSARWGSYPTGEGKVVWAELS